MKRLLIFAVVFSCASVLSSYAQSGNSSSQKQTDTQGTNSQENDAARKFPFPEDQETPNAPADSQKPGSQKNDAPERFPFPGDAPTQPPRSDSRGPNDSSSRDRNVDISPPDDDSTHPGSDLAGPGPADGVTEMKPWNPHQADKDVEVGMYYFRQKNYSAAESRFREALHWQDNHAEAMYRLATVLEKLGKPEDAKQYYAQYLRIMPRGDFAKDSKKGLERVSAERSKKAEVQPLTSRP